MLKEAIEPKRVLERIPIAQVKKDLERYRRMALEMGASDARIISSKEVIVDERVRAKCIYPKCNHFGVCINCPPYAPDLDFVRKMISQYRNALLFCVKDETGVFLGGRSQKKLPGKDNPARAILYSVCAEVESRSYYDGYYLSLAFGQGPCKSFWCPDQPCAALQPGIGCRFPWKSRSSMEAVGMDVFGMAAKRGWEVYPCGQRVEKKAVPHVLLVGLILIC
jgi:predicted metal-binding protein